MQKNVINGLHVVKMAKSLASILQRKTKALTDGSKQKQIVKVKVQLI